MSNGKILLIVASQDYQPIEYGVPKKILEEAGFTVITASDKSGTATAKDGSTTQVDVVLDDVNVNDYNGIFLIGGPGALEHLDNETTYSIIKKAAQTQKPFGAICVSTRILAKAGALTGRQATGWDGDNLLEGVYQEHHVQYIKQNVVVDDMIITAVDPSVAQDFGEQIVNVVQDLKGWG